MLTGKRVVVTGGTGSLGQVLVRRLLEGELGRAGARSSSSRARGASSTTMRLAFQHRRVATDEIVYDEERHQRLHFRIGDVRDYARGLGAAAGRRRRLPRRGDEAGADLRVLPDRGGA